MFPFFTGSPFYPQRAQSFSDQEFEQPRMIYMDGHGPVAHFPRSIVPMHDQPRQDPTTQDCERALRRHQLVAKQLEQKRHEARQVILEREFERRNQRKAIMQELRRRLYYGQIDEDQAERMYVQAEKRLQSEEHRDKAMLRQLELEQEAAERKSAAYAQQLKEQEEARQYEEYMKEVEKRRAAQRRQHSTEELLDTLAGKPLVMTEEQQKQEEEARRRHQEHVQQQKQQGNTPHGILFPDGRTVYVNKGGKKKHRKPHHEVPLEPKPAPKEVKAAPLTEGEAATVIQHAYRASRLNHQLPHVAQAAKELDAVEAELNQTEPRITAALSAPLAFHVEHGNLDIKDANNKAFLALEDTLTKCLHKLDAIDSAGVDEVRAERKALVVRTTQALDKLDHWREQEWERWWKQVDAEHMQEAQIDVKAIDEQVQKDIQEGNVIEDYSGEDEEEVLSHEVRPIEPLHLHGQFIDELVAAIKEVDEENYEVVDSGDAERLMGIVEDGEPVHRDNL